MSIGPALPHLLPHLLEELQELRKNWGWFLALGILLVVAGCVAISAYFVAALASLAVIATILLIGGGVELVSSLRAGHWRGFFVHVLSGILYLILGLLMVRRPEAAASVFTLMLAAAFLAGGLVRIIAAIAHRFPGWGWVLLNGVVTLGLGILIWMEWPEISFWIIGVFVGIELIFSGWSWIMLALWAKNVPLPPTT